MKTLRNTLFILLAILSFSLFACNNSHNSNNHLEETTDTSGKEYTSKYVCPMHCEGSGSNEMGTCPVCEMDYVLNENYQETDMEHMDHDGHEH